MNLHLEDRRKLRTLARPVEPAHDLWPQIAARIASQPRVLRRRFQRLALAASLAGVAVLAGVIGINIMRGDQSRGTIAHLDTAYITASGGSAIRWKPADPRLRGAAVELHAAQGELKQALAIAPHADYLQQLLERTEQQQTHLQRLERDAG